MASKRISDADHPTTEEFAERLYVLTPADKWPEPFTGRTGVWEREPTAVRVAFRDRARRFMAGDLSIAPWV
jgi:hypothetical protein